MNKKLSHYKQLEIKSWLNFPEKKVFALPKAQLDAQTMNVIKFNFQARM